MPVRDNSAVCIWSFFIFIYAKKKKNNILHIIFEMQNDCLSL